jgi:DNA-binding IscR family transcriptional regulator
MSIDCKTNRAGYCDLMAFFIEIDCNIRQFKLLCFMVRHPRTRLSIDSIAGVLDISRACLVQEVTALVEKGIILEQDENGPVTYSLSSDPEIHRHVAILTALDWSEKLNIMSRLRDSSCS